MTNGWIAGTCNAGLADALLVSHDGGVSWADQPLPLPATTCAGGACTVRGPQFVGGTGFVTVEPEPDGPALLVTPDLGQTWTPVPQGADLTRLGVTIDFTNPQDGFAWTNGLESDPVPATTIYETTNSGRSWHSFTPKLAG